MIEDIASECTRCGALCVQVGDDEYEAVYDEPARPVWVVKVEDQYLARYKGGSASCEFKQKRAIRFTDQGKAYRVAHRTFGLASEDDESGARVVRLVPKRSTELPSEDPKG